MEIQAQVVASIVVLVSLICLSALLRRAGVVAEEDGALLSKLVFATAVASAVSIVSIFSLLV